MKILVTGGAGFIGSNFIRHVLALGNRYSIVNYDKLTYAGNLANLDSVATHPDYTFVRGDICDAPALEAAMPSSVPTKITIRPTAAHIQIRSYNSTCMRAPPQGCRAPRWRNI